MHSDAVEDYLKAIYGLQERDGLARTGALARQLGITAGSVTEMIKRMARMSPRLISYRQHHGVTLTARGRQAAVAIIRRHRLLETFLHQVLGLGWEAVHEEAERLEHHLSERLVRAIDRHLSASPVRSPRGADTRPVRAYGHACRYAAHVAGRQYGLSHCRVDPSLDGMLDYLDELKLGLGITGRVVDQAPFGGPVTLRINSSDSGHRETAIGREIADRIFVVKGSAPIIFSS
jgi:DtxR family Mn-dependent transcriptional regulator